MDDVDRKILALERRRWLRPGVKEQAIRDETGLSPTVFYLRLNRLLDNPEAALAEPVLIGRLRRQRDRMAQQRRAG